MLVVLAGVCAVGECGDMDGGTCGLLLVAPWLREG